jgi:hypothetical protein
LLQPLQGARVFQLQRVDRFIGGHALQRALAAQLLRVQGVQSLLCALHLVVQAEQLAFGEVALRKGVAPNLFLQSQHLHGEFAHAFAQRLRVGRELVERRRRWSCSRFCSASRCLQGVPSVSL